MATYNAKEVPDLNTQPKGWYHFEVVKCEHSAAEEPCMIVLSLKALGPEEKIGMRYTERYRLGTDSDPQAEEPETKKSGMTGMNWARWLDLTKALGIHTGDTEEEAEAIIPGTEFMSYMSRREGKDKDTKEPTGKSYNSLVRFDQVGKREPKLDEAMVPANDGPAPKGKTASKPVTSTTSAAKGKTAPAAKATAPAAGMFKCEVEGCGKTLPKRLQASHQKMHEADAGEE